MDGLGKYPPLWNKKRQPEGIPLITKNTAAGTIPLYELQKMGLDAGRIDEILGAHLKPDTFWHGASGFPTS